MGGEDELSTGAGMVNVPLIEEQVALRVAGEYQRSESALDYPTYERFDHFGDFKEDEFLSVRSKLRVRPKALPRTRVLLLYSYAEDAPDVSDIGGPVLGFAFDDDRGDFNTPIFSEVRRTTVHSGGLDVVQEATSALLLTAQSGSPGRIPSGRRSTPARPGKRTSSPATSSSICSLRNSA